MRDGVEGRIIPIRDSRVIAEAVAGLARNIELRHHMAEQAGRRAKSFDLAAYGRRLMDALDLGRARRIS